MSSRRVLAVGLLAPFALLAGCSRSSASTTPARAAEARAVVVRTAPVVEERVARRIRISGRLQGKQEMTLSFRDGGTVHRLLVDTGRAVKKGELLATLDRTESSARVDQAEAAFTKARRDLARAEEQRAGGAIAVADYQNARTLVDQTEAGLRAARHVDQLTTLRAPEDGQIQRRLVEVNEQVGPGQPVFAMRAAGRGWVTRVGLADRDAVQVRIGDRATVRFDAFPSTVFAGVVTEMAGAASPQTGTYEVEVAVEPGPAQLLSGLVAKVELEPSEVPLLRAVPIEAVVEGNGLEAAVYIAQSDATARRVPIRIAFIEGNEVAVTSGLESVAEVITDGAPFLSPGARLRRVE